MGEIIKWVIIVLLAVSTLGGIALIGEERKPLTPGTVIGNVILTGLVIAAIVTYLN